MTGSPPAEFFALSSLLTGFTKETLEFAQQAADFYGEFENTYGAATTKALLTLYTTRSAARDTADEIADHFLGDQADEALSAAARALIVFWYLGQIGTPEDPETLTIPSANLYVQGLAWRAVQAHPTGSSILQFGYWAAPPPPLSDFL